MKTAALILLTMAFIFIGCKKNEETTTTSTTSTTATDTSGTTSTTGTGSATGTTAANLSRDDKEFIDKAAEAGNAEVSEGQLAGTKAADADVKNFGSTMVSDHGKAGDELKSLASSKGITIPTGPGKDGEEAINKLTSKNGKDFDKAYMKDAVDDHEKAVKLFEKESKDGQDPDLKSWAAKTLPTLQKHLDMAKATKKKVG